MRDVLDVDRGRAADRGLHRALEHKPRRKGLVAVAAAGSSGSGSASALSFFSFLVVVVVVVVVLVAVLAAAPSSGGVERERRRKARRLGHGRDDRRQDRSPHPLVPDDPSRPDAGLAGLELRFDEDDEVGRVLEEGGDGREDLFVLALKKKRFFFFMKGKEKKV